MDTSFKGVRNIIWIGYYITIIKGEYSWYTSLETTHLTFFPVFAGIYFHDSVIVKHFMGVWFCDFGQNKNQKSHMNFSIVNQCNCYQICYIEKL